MKLELVDGTNDPVLKPGQAYIRTLIDEEKKKRKILWIACYKCGLTAITSLHSLIEHEDGTVTITGYKGSSSLKCPNPKACDAHYFIERSEIRV